MDTVDDKKMQRVLDPVAESDITAEHREWMNAEITARLDKKARGETAYTRVDDVRGEFGLDAS